MAYAGKEIGSVQLGLRMVFRETAADTNGEFLRLDIFISPDRAVFSKHMHPHQQETIEVVAGGLDGEVGDSAKSLRPGDVSIIPPEVMHHWHSLPGDETHLRVEFRPAMQIEVVFETILGLAADGKLKVNGMPPLMQSAVFIAEYGDMLYFPIPAPIKKVMAVALAPIARRMGYRASYPKYTESVASPPVG